jgi:uncharacterized protein DUF4159
MRFGIARPAPFVAGVIGILAVSVLVCYAQQIWRGGYGYTPPRFPTSTTFNGSFNFCRVLFRSDRREKSGWSTDYPGADLNFSTRLGELTKTDIKMGHGAGEDDIPDAVVVRLTDDALFHCPFVLMEDAGTARFSDAEVLRLREYLLKGGFLLVSDYHGTFAKAQFDEEIERVLPPARYPVVDLTPPNHTIWNTLFRVQNLPQMASIQTWRRTGGTIERWNDDRGGPDARGIADDRGRLMVVMIHNTDVPDGWEREGEDPQYFFNFSPEAYAVGIDVVLYALTH